MTGRSQAIKPEVRAAGAQNSWNFCLSRNKVAVRNDSRQEGREVGRGVPARQAGPTTPSTVSLGKRRGDYCGALSRTMIPFNWVFKKIFPHAAKK